jgi:hypothetical protein
MKHQYFGDENDYRKYGLLRVLTQEGGLSLGIFWMLTQDDHRSDGRFTSYLNNLTYRRHDPELFDALKRAMASGHRHLSHVENEQILPGARFFDELVPDDTSSRRAVFQRALEQLSGVDLIFFDPDNGLEVPSKPRGRRDSCKFLFWDEVRAAYAAGHSLLIYQHFPREERSAFTRRMAFALGDQVGSSIVVSLSTTRVLFLLVPQEGPRPSILRGLDALADNWGGQIRIQHHAVSDSVSALPLSVSSVDLL